MLCGLLLQRQAAAKIEDLQQNGIDLELMHMSPPDRPFDIQAFYKVFHIIFLILYTFKWNIFILILLKPYHREF